METVENRLLGFVELCREAGLKATHQRTGIYRELARTDEHPDADTVFRRVRRRVPAISLDTVYRTLRLLEERSVIWRVASVGDRTRFDANTARHHHFVCRGCGRVQDFTHKEFDSFPTPRDVAGLGVVESVCVELRGLCTNCRAKRRGGA